MKGALTSTVAWGIVLGLVVGKPLGITLATGLGVRLRVGRLPNGLTFRHVIGAGCVAGIGFTVSLFVADLSFDGMLLREAKTGILAASVLSAIVGSAWLFRTQSPTHSVRRDTGRHAVEVATGCGRVAWD